MTPEVITVDPENTLREVIDILSASSVGGAPVVSGGKVVGVISKSDVLDFLATTPGVPVGRADFAQWGKIEQESPEEERDDGPVAFYTDLWEDATGHFAKPPAPTFLTRGEPVSSDRLRRHIQDRLGWTCYVPQLGETVALPSIGRA
jgi:hypothetical protein